MVSKEIQPTRKLRAVWALFFVAPFVAEYLLGDLPLKLLPVLVVLAPMYGGGAVLIRETARRMGRGWPTMLVLGMAYTVVEEAFISQSLFNPDYLRMHMHLLQPAYIPALGIGAWWTVFMFNLHSFWSISVSIALVEALWPERQASVWLGRAGDSAVAVIFVLGLALNAVIGFKQNYFLASHVQFIWSGIAVPVLIALALLLPIRGDNAVQGRMLHPWITGVSAFAFGIGVLVIPRSWNWGAVAAILALDAAFLALLAQLSRRSGWTSLHSLSVAAGGAVAYGVRALFLAPLVHGSLMMARIGNVVFLFLAIALIVVAARRLGSAVAETDQSKVAAG